MLNRRQRQMCIRDRVQCGRLEHGFLRMRCNHCHAEHLVAFSCKCRGFCPSCGARRMAESAALLVDEVLPEQPMAQWVLSFPYPLRFLFATQPVIMTGVLGIVYRAIATHLIHRLSVIDVNTWSGSSTVRGSGHCLSNARCVLNHVIVLNERHLKRILYRYFNYDHRWRTRLSLGMNSPESRLVQRPAVGKVVHNQKSVAYIIIIIGCRHDTV